VIRLRCNREREREREREEEEDRREKRREGKWDSVRSLSVFFGFSYKLDDCVIKSN
jgi:hypothetical protein